MYRLPGFVNIWLRPWIICSIKPDDQRKVYITFDDGPHPETTPQILSQLRDYQAKASFFVLASSALRYPETLTQIRDAGHSIHLHSYDHIRPILQRPRAFIQEMEQCRRIVGSSLYRPPYGKCPPWHLFALLRKRFRIVLWNVDLSDYHHSIPDQDLLDRFLKKIKPGDILLLHDNPRFIRKTLLLLPKVLQELQRNCCTFERIL